MRRCPDAAANCSDSHECSESSSGCRGTVNHSLARAGRRRLDESPSNSSLGCYTDLQGTFCRLCAPHPEGKGVYYAVATTKRRAQCRECRDTVRNTILIGFGYAALAAFVLLSFYLWYIAIASADRKRHLQCAWHAFTPHIKIKICIGFYMIATKIDQVYEVCTLLARLVPANFVAFCVFVSCQTKHGVLAPFLRSRCHLQ